MEKAAFRFHQHRRQQHQQQRKTTSQDEINNAYEVLGVTAQNSNAEIKKA